MSSTNINGPVVLPSDNIQPNLPNGLHTTHLPPNNVPPQDGPSNELPAEPPRVGMAYESMAAAKKHITDWCLRERIPYSVWKADRRCWVLTCKDKNNCLFRLRVKNTDRPIISILEAHTCSSLSFRRTAQTGGPIKATPYNWPHDASLAPSTTALVLVDMQRDLCAPGGFLEQQGEDISAVRKLIPSLQRLLHAFRGAGFPVYHTREGHRSDLTTLSSREAFRSQNNTSGLGIGYPGPLGRFLVRGEEGHDTIPELYPVPGEPIIDKPGRGAFAHTDFELLLRNKGVQNLVVAGIATDVSISSTIREATDRGFDCLLVEDGCTAKDGRLHKMACESIALGGGTFGATGKLHHVAGQLEFIANERRNGLEQGLMPQAPMSGQMTASVERSHYCSTKLPAVPQQRLTNPIAAIKLNPSDEKALLEALHSAVCQDEEGVLGWECWMSTLSAENNAVNALISLFGEERERRPSGTMSTEKVFRENVQEDAVLESLGYQQELKRSFGLLGMIGFSFSIVTSWTALGGVLIVGVESGGPPVMIYSWIGISIFALAVAYSMAEICSAYPVAGGQYSWVAVLAPPSVARGMSYVTGWFMITGILAMGATNNFITANFILGQANLSFPSYSIERWHVVLLAYLIAWISTAVNIYGPHLLDKISRAAIIWNMLSFVVVIITILACNDHKQPASFVFKDFQNFSGFSTAYCAILGLLQSSFGMCCYDAPAHMTEEMKNASREAPKAIVMSVYIGAFTGFVFLISICFCIGDIDSTAGSTTGVPLIEIFFNSTQSVVGTCFLSSMIVVITLICANALLAEGSRSLYAFARDRGLPFSDLFAKVEPRRQVPVYSILLTCVVQMALNSIYFGTLTGFNTVISIATEGFYLSYAMPLLVRIIAYFSNYAKVIPGPYTLGRWSVWLNAIGLLFLVFTSITFNFPTINPVDEENMNYTSAAIGVIGLISIITWITTGRKSFTGPQIGSTNVVEGVDIRKSLQPSGRGGAVVD